MKTSRLIYSIGALTTALMFANCQDEELGYTADQIAYQTNFQKAFGNISEIPTWDLSSYNLKKMGLEGGPSNDFAAIGGAQTRAFTGTASEIVSDYNGKWYNVQERSTRWMNKYLAEKVDNRSQGKAFTLINPYYDEDNEHREDRDFLIIPIYQGASGMCWDLHLVDDQYDYTIWSKSKDFKYTVYHNEWEEFFYKDLTNIYDHQAGGDKRAIRFNGAFANYNDLSGAQVFFELNAGSMKGKFAIQQNVGNNTWKIAYISEDELTLSASDTKESKPISLDLYVGKTYKSSDGNNDIAVAENFSNLFFVPTEQNGGVVLDPYPAQRLHIYVKTNDTTSDTRYLYNFTSDNTHVSDGNFSGGYPAYDSRTEVSSESYFFGHTINRNNVQSKVMKIDTKKLGREFTLYLETKYSDQYNTCYAEYGDKHRSNGDPNMMVALHAFNRDGVADSEKPIDIRKTLEDLDIISEGASIDGYEYMVVGCEDAASQSDNDYNDVVLLFVGMPKVPKIATEVIQKRYMIEDLGSTFDFDFNDIVVDVTQENIVNLKTGEETKKQIVSVAHLCGTIPFDLHFKDENAITTTAIFDHKFAGKNDNANNTAGAGSPGYDPRSDANYMTKYVKTYTLSTGLPWRPDENNLVVYVWPNKAGLTDNMGDGNSSLYNDGTNNLLEIKAAQRIDFPKEGQFPYIIAVDQDINWTPELYQIPKSWFETEENQGQYEQGGSIPGVKPNNPADATDQDFNALGGTIIPANKFATNNVSGVTTLDLGDFVNDNSHKYRAGDITVKVGLSANCAYDKTSVLPEVKILLVNKSNGQAFADGSVSLNNFVANSSNSNIIEQSFVINNEEILAAAKSNNLTLQVTYATYGFTEGWNPRARMSLSWPNNVPYGTVTKKNGTYDSENTSSYGEHITITTTGDNQTYKDEYGARNIFFGTGYATTGQNPLTADQNAYVTIVVPAHTTINNASIQGYDGANIYSTTIPALKNDTDSKQVFTIQLSDVFKEQLLSGWPKNQVRLRITDSSVTLDVLQTINVYVNWDNNLPKKKLTIVNGDTDFDQLGLTIKVNGADVTYNASGIQVSPNATVSVAGFWDTNKQVYTQYTGQNDYRIMWTSAKVSNISDTEHNEPFEFKMPNEDVSITADFLYKMTPVMHKYSLADVATATSLGSDESYAKDNGKIVAYDITSGIAGDITLEWEGRKSINGPIFVKYNATVKATIAVNDGYVFKGWRWKNGNTSTTITHTMDTRGNHFNPHAAIYEGYRVTVAAIPAAAGTVKIGESAAASTVVGGYAANTNLTLTASEPNTGYAFVKWSSGDITLSRTLKVTENSDPVALYQKGTQIIDNSSSPVEVANERAWDQFRYNNNNQGAENYTALYDALSSTNNKLHIYCREQTGNIKLFTFGKNDDRWGWLDLTDGISFENGEVTVTLSDIQIAQIKNTDNRGLVIQNNSDKPLHFYKIIVE